jgi:hypothetical protein
MFFNNRFGVLQPDSENANVRPNLTVMGYGAGAVS